MQGGSEPCGITSEAVMAALLFRAHGKKPVFSQCLDITSYICKKECDGEESLHRVGGMSTSGRND